MKLHRMDDDHLVFFCPGCECGHMVKVTGDHPVWAWNGSEESPTLSPSILLRSGHFAPGHTGRCWCDYNKDNPDNKGFECYVCHSFVTNGRIQFLSDSTHKLSSQTVEIPDWDD